MEECLRRNDLPCCKDAGDKAQDQNQKHRVDKKCQTVEGVASRVVPNESQTHQCMGDHDEQREEHSPRDFIELSDEDGDDSNESGHNQCADECVEEECLEFGVIKHRIDLKKDKNVSCLSKEPSRRLCTQQYCRVHEMLLRQYKTRIFHRRNLRRQTLDDLAEGFRIE